MLQLREKTALALVAMATIAGLGSCSGSQSLPALAETPAPETRATLVGPLCEPGRCQCSEAAGDPVQTAREGMKRYEVRLGPSDNDLWATIGDQVFYKSVERASECWTIELPPGRHPVRLRASRPTGFGASLKISELAPEGQGWYDTFVFECGAPGLCDRETLRNWKARVASYDDNVHDPCGSTKIRQVVWQTGRLPDSQPPGDLQLDFILDVYEFTPTFGPGAPECARK